MRERQDLVRVDPTGAAHPVGRLASREMRGRQGGHRLLASPSHVVAMRQSRGDEDEDGPAEFWIVGELSKPGQLWDLVGLIGQGNWTGELAVHDAEHQRSIFFERGAVLGATSNAERERLGEILYQYGALTREEVSIVAEALSREVRFGEAAVALGFLSPEKLFELIGKQTEEIVYGAMAVPRGSFYFSERFDERRLPYRLNLAVTGLLMEGVRRMDEMECFRARIPSSTHVPERVPGKRLSAGHEHEAVWLEVDGVRSIDDIGRVLGLGQFETTRALFQLSQEGLVAVHPPRPTTAQALVALFNRAMALILERVDQAGGGRAVRDQLASFATASGVYDALFRDAGPRPDGTLDPDRIAETLAGMVGPADRLGMLAQWLYEYASFAMFIAEPLLRSRSDPNGQSEGAAVSRQVAELLAPLAES
jgi:hypothetical protein